MYFEVEVNSTVSLSRWLTDWPLIKKVSCYMPLARACNKLIPWIFFQSKIGQKYLKIFVIRFVLKANTNMVFVLPCFAYRNQALFSFKMPNHKTIIIHPDSVFCRKSWRKLAFLFEFSIYGSKRQCFAFLRNLTILIKNLVFGAQLT